MTKAKAKPNDYHDYLLRGERRLVSVMLLTVLQAILNELTLSRTINKETNEYIYLSIRESAKRFGYI